MKYFIATLLAVFALQSQASSKSEKITNLVVAAIEASNLDRALADSPRDLAAVKNSLVKTALRDSVVAAEIRHILVTTMNDLSHAEGDQFRRRVQEIARYRLLLIAGENGYVPQDQ